MATTRRNETTEEASPLVPPYVTIPIAVWKLLLWDDNGRRQTSENQVKYLNSWTVPCCSTLHVTYALPPLRSTSCLPVSDDTPLPPAPITNRKSIYIISEVKYSSWPAPITDDDDNPTEFSYQVKDSNYITFHLDELKEEISKHITCKTCNMHYHHGRIFFFHRYSKNTPKKWQVRFFNQINPL